MHRDEEETKKRTPKAGRAEPCGIPLGPSKQVEVTLPKDLTVVLTRTAFSRLFGYAQATELEVSLLGIVDRDGSDYADKKAEVETAKQDVAAS